MDEKTISLNGEHGISVITTRYDINDRLAVYLEQDGEYYQFVSQNLPNEAIGDGEFAVKTYGENIGLYEALRDAGVLQPTGRRTNELSLPICTLCDAFLIDPSGSL